jgi:hypothetical protein
MKTQGIQIVDGFLVVPYRKAVPPAFWSRLQHEIAKVGLSAEFQTDRDAEAKREGLPWEREEILFRRWVQKLELATDTWPWDRGWTPELVDSYLTRPVTHWQEAAEKRNEEGEP